MRATDQKRQVTQKLCPCGRPAVKFTAGAWACPRCLAAEARLYGTANGRGVCGRSLAKTERRRQPTANEPSSVFAAP